MCNSPSSNQIKSKSGSGIFHRKPSVKSQQANQNVYATGNANGQLQQSPTSAQLQQQQQQRKIQLQIKPQAPAISLNLSQIPPDLQSLNLNINFTKLTNKFSKRLTHLDINLNTHPLSTLQKLSKTWKLKSLRVQHDAQNKDLGLCVNDFYLDELQSLCLKLVRFKSKLIINEIPKCLFKFSFETEVVLPKLVVPKFDQRMRDLALAQYFEKIDELQRL
ncbi:unnamed protein product [Ambrosiozyma monospora]|uniref:Unnamed protein product n=1 Tax=Ambrosiozyma monospora TaxID=43982 RepID=A0ACB5T2X2_AMBMO|nr:unnamed protein product [Ambrosiozyma monospora]